MSDLCTHQQPRHDCHRCARARLTLDFRTIVHELIGEVTTSEQVTPTAIPGWKPPRDGRPVPKRIRYETRAPGLITQLEDAADQESLTGQAPGGSGGGHAKPGSRPPSSLHALDTLIDIEHAILTLRQRADTQAGITTHPRSRGIRHELRHLSWLIDARRHGQAFITDRTAREFTREARTWAADARVALSYLAPVKALQVRCPDCGGEMRVRGDATSDVWCVGRCTVEGPALEQQRWPLTVPCGARWPRFTWIQLLDTATTTQETVA